MSHNPSHDTLVLSAVKNVTPERLQRAVCGLADGTMTVTLTMQSEAEIQALVRNGNGSEYTVTLTADLVSCSCKDARYRDVTCKHAIGTALHVLRPEDPKPEQETPDRITHLMWSDGAMLCREPYPEPAILILIF